MNYTIFAEPDIGNLIKLVNEWMDEGWRAQGGLVVFEGVLPPENPNEKTEYGRACRYFAQAMVRVVPA